MVEYLSPLEMLLNVFVRAMLDREKRAAVASSMDCEICVENGGTETCSEYVTSFTSPGNVGMDTATIQRLDPIQILNKHALYRLN